ncbi:zinc protease [Desulfosarcina sp. BuS5]|nr:zinc protease [Desulfosarcina sp. BuS5]
MSLMYRSLRFSILFFVILSLLSAASLQQSYAFNSADIIAVSLPKWPHEESDLLPDPGLVYGRFPNGFRYVLLKNAEPKDRVDIHLDVLAGSLNETDQEQGLAHFLEHLLFCGSTHFKPGELVKYFQSIGMKFGADANAHTGFNETVYNILLPDGNKESLEKGLVVIKDYAEGAFLLEDEIKREMGVILAEKRTRDSASYRTYVETLKFELPESMISRRLPIGKEEIIKNAHRGLLKGFYDAWYRPEKLILIMVGDFNPEVAANLVKEKFSMLKHRAAARTDVDTGLIEHKGNKSFYHYEKESGSTSVSIETVHKALPHPDSFAFQKKKLIGNIADSIIQHRIDVLVSKPDTPFTSASIGSGTYLNEVEYTEITAKCGPESWSKSLSLLEQTLRRALEYGFTKSELERVKKDYIATFHNAAKRASTRNSGILAGSIIRALNNNQVFQSPEQIKLLYTPVVSELTLKDVHNALKAAWADDHRLVIVTGNADLSGHDASPEEIILNAFNKSSSVELKKPVEMQDVVFPYLPEPGQPGKAATTTRLPELNIVQVEFKNGLRLNMKRTDFKANQVLVKLSFGSGRSSEPLELPGLALLSEDVVNESGLGRLDKESVNRALAGKTASISFGISEDNFFFTGSSSSGEIELLFQLLYAHIIDPGYREDAFRLVKERFGQSYKSLSHSIDGSMVLSGNRFLAGGDTRFGFPPYEAFNALTLDNIRSWIDKPLKNEQMELSIVGDFNLEEVERLAGKYLGALKKRNPVKMADRASKPLFPVSRNLELRVETKIPKALVVVAYPSSDLWNISLTRRLSVLADVFSERLREKIREKLGVSYSPFAYNRPSRAYPGYGVLFAFVHISPDKTDLVRQEVKNIVSELCEKGVTPEELKRAVDPTLTSIKDMLKKNGYWLNTVLSGSAGHPEQLEWCRTIMKDYASITDDEISNLAVKYLKNTDAATIIITPPKQETVQ